jgi:predicted nuclease of predicted toxin-antitoxin system
LAGKTDQEIRRYAIETGRILVTLDADFGNLIRFSPTGTPGVILAGLDLSTVRHWEFLLLGDFIEAVLPSGLKNIDCAHRGKKQLINM